MIKKIRMWTIVIICLTSISIFSEDSIRLEKAELNTHDLKSIEHGAKNFALYCMACHTLTYMKNDHIALAAGITPRKMPEKNQQWWFGSAPPDLSLIARIRGEDWLYTYLHVFYIDLTRPTRSNNLLIPDVNMPNPFLGLQGEQVLLIKQKQLVKNSLLIEKPPYYTVIELTRTGSMTPDNFDMMTRDLVNFLVYASDPKKYTREKMGIWVLIFIAVLFVLIYLLKKEYWKDINNHRK